MGLWNGSPVELLLEQVTSPPTPPSWVPGSGRGPAPGTVRGYGTLEGTAALPLPECPLTARITSLWLRGAQGSSQDHG